MDLKCYVKKTNKIVNPKIINFAEKYISVAKRKSSSLGFFSDVYKFGDIIFLEYTTKKDKNNKKIYRGDILEIKTDAGIEKGVVEIENFSWKLKCNGYTLDFSEIEKEVFKNCKIVGNIYLIEDERV